MSDGCNKQGTEHSRNDSVVKGLNLSKGVDHVTIKSSVEGYVRGNDCLTGCPYSIRHISPESFVPCVDSKLL